MRKRRALKLVDNDEWTRGARQRLEQILRDLEAAGFPDPHGTLHRGLQALLNRKKGVQR